MMFSFDRHDAAGWIAAALGLAAVAIVTALTSSPANALGAALLYIGLLAGGFASILLHELGHALAAWLIGWRVWIISVLPIIVRFGHPPRLSTKLSHDVGGYVLGSPPTMARDSRWRSIIFSAGGPLASLLTGPLFIAWLTTLPRSGWETPTGAGLLGAALAFGCASTWSAVWTLWPMRSRSGRPNDMLMILATLGEPRRPAEASGGAWAAALFENGVEPSAWPAWMRDAVTRGAASPWATPESATLAFVSALESGDEAGARTAAQRGGRVLRAFVLVCFDGDAAGAESKLGGASPDPDWETLAWLRRVAEARIADLTGDASTAQLTREALRREIRSGPPHPFWERRLSAPWTF